MSRPSPWTQSSGGYSNGHHGGGGYGGGGGGSSYQGAPIEIKEVRPKSTTGFASASDYRRQHDLVVLPPQGETAPEPLQTFESVGFPHDILAEVSRQQGRVSRARDGRQEEQAVHAGLEETP